MDPVPHLSIVVADLDGARRFYVDVLGCRPGRTRADWMDVWFHGMQLALQCRPEQVLTPAQQGGRHFGVTLGADEFAALTGRLLATPEVSWLVPVTTDDPDTALEQTKCKLEDPSGNVIEFKTYADPEAAFAAD